MEINGCLIEMDCTCIGRRVIRRAEKGSKGDVYDRKDKKIYQKEQKKRIFVEMLYKQG